MGRRGVHTCSLQDNWIENHYEDLEDNVKIGLGERRWGCGHQCGRLVGTC
jgi:hypothetical protein